MKYPSLILATLMIIGAIRAMDTDKIGIMTVEKLNKKLVACMRNCKDRYPIRKLGIESRDSGPVTREDYMEAKGAELCVDLCKTQYFGAFLGEIAKMPRCLTDVLADIPGE